MFAGRALRNQTPSEEPRASPRSLCEIEESDVVTGEELGMPLGQQQFCRGGVVADTVGMGKTAQVRTPNWELLLRPRIAPC